MSGAHLPAHRRRPAPGPVGGSLRKIAKRVPALKAMAIEPIGDIAAPSLTENVAGNLTWETATDWDNAVSESGVVHESVTNTDHNDATIVKQGYQLASPTPSTGLLGYWPLHEDSGSTANDVSVNNQDGTINGATVNVSAILGTTGYSFDGTIAEVRIYDERLTNSEVQTLFDTVDTPGSLETATKSFDSGQTPDLVADVSLNTVTSFEVDVIGSPSGTSETNTVTVDTDGENTYAITWSSSHTDYRVKPKPANGGDKTVTPNINKLELTA